MGELKLGEDDIAQTQIYLAQARSAYERNAPKQWIVLALGLILGAVIGTVLPSLVNKLTHSLYSRTSLDSIMKTLLGSYTIDQVLTDEIMIVAYDYNSQQPRFYSKYFAERNPQVYNVPIGNATGASSAAPTYFDPKVNVNGFGMDELLIDGGIICNDPAMYAYQLAKNMHNEKKVRVMSVGTGEKPFKTVDAKTMNIFDYVSKMGEFMMNMDTYTADNWLKQYMNHDHSAVKNKDYLRLQTVSTIGMDKIDAVSIAGLKVDGQTLYDDNKADIEDMIKAIIDERYGPKN